MQAPALGSCPTNISRAQSQDRAQDPSVARTAPVLLFDIWVLGGRRPDSCSCQALDRQCFSTLHQAWPGQEIGHAGFEDCLDSAAPAELASQFPFLSPSETCTGTICHQHYAKRISQARFDDSCQLLALRLLTYPLLQSRFQNLFAATVALFPGDLIK